MAFAFYKTEQISKEQYDLLRKALIEISKNSIGFMKYLSSTKKLIKEKKQKKDN